MTAYEKLRAARGSKRPTGAAYVKNIFTDCVELHGDRRFGDDPAIVSGVGFLGDIPVTYIAIDKGADINERIKKNFGCPKPEGYRKALRLMKQAEKFHRPVICFVDTQGAFCGADAEERGQGEAIAENILEMMGLATPVVTIVIGEGGSGGALALAAAEGCASILWKDAGRVSDAAEALHITAEDMRRYHVADDIIPEDFDNFEDMCRNIGAILFKDVYNLSKLSTEELKNKRYDRFRAFGFFSEK